MTFLNDSDLKILRDAGTTKKLTVDNTVLTSLEEMVIDEVSSYLNGRYDTYLIFSQTDSKRSPLILRIVIDIMLYYLYLRIASDDIPEYIQTTYKNNLKMLTDIASGKLAPKLPHKDSSVEIGGAPITSISNKFYN